MPIILDATTRKIKMDDDVVDCRNYFSGPIFSQETIFSRSYLISPLGPLLSMGKLMGRSNDTVNKCARSYNKKAERSNLLTLILQTRGFLRSLLF